MLITTSRRPGHRARVLCRELARVLPKARYVPRGAKTVEQLASLAGGLGHARVIIVNSIAGRPKELQFLDVTKGWRWLDARVELGEVKLQRDLGQRVKLEGTNIYAEGKRARELADFLMELLGLQATNKLPDAGAVAVITSNGGLKLEFQLRPSSGVVGPVLVITDFG
ncbi:MAG: hypothetical protein QMD00_01685 [Hadesarchaea archaeon]|nr:hypothetical protein [Hadesarchaea archaeon]